MKTVAGAFLIAILLFAGAAAAWSEARLARRVADARQRLATLHYDTEDGIDDTTLMSRLPWRVGTLATDVGRYRATVAYWQSRYRELMGSLPAAGGNNPATSDPEVMFVAANAAFRASQADVSDRSATVDRLDRVIQAYADVLRLSPDLADASFNYEFVSKFRDTFARSKPARGAKEPKPPAHADTTIDLPSGPTVHGRPGAPPPDVTMERFRTITPMRFDEREESEPGRGPAPRRRG
jgi:hypothetical protein